MNDCIIDLHGINENLFHYGKGVFDSEKQGKAIMCLHIYLKLILYSNMDTFIFARSTDDLEEKIETNDDIYIKTKVSIGDSRFSNKICKIIKSKDKLYKNKNKHLLQCNYNILPIFSPTSEYNSHKEYIDQLNDDFKPIEKEIPLRD